MSNRLRLREPAPSALGGLIWPAIGIFVFAAVYLASLPGTATLQKMHAVAPGGAMSYFATPEAAVAKINRLLERHEWLTLARYYDLSQSAVTPDLATSGAYFAGRLAAPTETPRLRPFPPGWRYLYVEPTPAEGIVRVVVAPPDARNPAPGETQSFFMEHLPEGYRLIPADTAAQLSAGPSVP